MSPNEQKITPGRDASSMARIDLLDRGDADRAPRAVEQRDLAGKELVDAELQDGVGLAAADLHERPRPRDQRADRAGPAPACRLASRILVDELHDSAIPEVELAQQLERLLRFVFVDDVERESGVHDDVVADHRLGHVGQADFLDDPAEADTTGPRDQIVTAEREDLAGNGEAHQLLSLRQGSVSTQHTVVSSRQ